MLPTIEETRMSQNASGTQTGRIELICGCMFTGKTGRLIDELVAARSAGLTVRAFKHPLDRRYGLRYLATHDGRRLPAEAVASAAEIIERSAGVAVAGIDEAQFFGRGLVRACRSLRARGQRVLVAGIDFDAWGRPFPPLPQLKQLADHVEVLCVPCSVAGCDQPACYSQRMVPVTDPDMVGGPEEYRPRCAAHFQPLPPPAPLY